MGREIQFDGFEDKVRGSFDSQNLMKTFGATLEAIAPGHCEIAAPISTATTQQHGYAHAGLTFAIGDSAAGYAALSLLGETQEVLTVEMKINLIAPASGDRLIAKGSVAKMGRRLIIVTSEVIAIDGANHTPVALLQGTMMPV